MICADSGKAWRELALCDFDRPSEPLDEDVYWSRLGYDVEGERRRDEARR